MGTKKTRHRLACHLVPENSAGQPIETDHPKELHAVVVDWFAFSVGAGFEIGITGNGGGEEYLVAPDDGARMAEAGNRSLPSEVQSLPGVPA